MSAERNGEHTEEGREEGTPAPETEPPAPSEAEAGEPEATAEGTEPSSDERTIRIDVDTDEGGVDTDKLVNDILENEQIRQTIEARIYSSKDQEIREYIRLKREAENQLKLLQEDLEVVDIVFERERYKKINRKIEAVIEQIGRHTQKIQQRQREKDLEKEIHKESGPDKMDSIRQRMQNAFDRDIIFAILVIMFPQMEWPTLQSIFQEVIDRIGDNVIPTIAQQKAARMQQQDSGNDEGKAPIVVQFSLIEERIETTIQRIHAIYDKREVAGEQIEVICFKKEELPVVDEYIKKQYQSIILKHIIPALVSLVCEEDLKWEVRQQIGYAIGEFMQQHTSRIYNLLTAAWAVSDNASIRATTGYLLSRAVEEGLRRESVLRYLKGWINSGDSKLQWTAASACKEIGKVDIELALDGLQQVLRSQPDAPILSAIAYSLVVLSLNGFYREVISALSQWIVKEENLRKVYVLLFLDIFNTFLMIVLRELQRYGKEGMGNQDNIESKSIEALWRFFTHPVKNPVTENLQMEEDFRKAIVDILVTVISSPVDLLDALLSRFNVDLLGRWLDAFSQEDDERTHEPQVRDIVEDLLVEVYNQLASVDEDTPQPSVSNVRARSRREKRLAEKGSRRVRTSEHQDAFWLLIKPWQEEPRGSIKQEVFNKVSQSVRIEGRRARRGDSRRTRRNESRRRW